MAVRLLHYSDVENAYDDPERVGRLAGLVAARRDADALVLGTGDNTAPGALSLACRGRQALDLFAAIEPDAETFGNHDFDYGPERTLELVRESPQRWVCANARRDGEPFGADAGVVPWTVLEAGDARVGVVGVTHPLTVSATPRAAGLTFTDPVAAAREAVATLRERAEYVVALSHAGRGDDDLAALDVDAVLGGHLHAERAERVDGTVLTRPGVNGEVVYEVSLPGGGITRHEVAAAPLDEGLAATMRRRREAAGIDEVVARVDEPVERTRAAALGGESRIGNFVADAYRWAAGADVGLQNAGGIREGSPLAGDVTVGDLMGVVPFDEPVAVAELTGADLAETFRHASGAVAGLGEPEWWHAHVSGARVVYDHDRRDLVEVTVGGEPLDPEATYTLATTDYLFHADHEFPPLRASHRTCTLDVQYEVLADYARQEGIAPAVEGRVVRNGI